MAESALNRPRINEDEIIAYYDNCDVDYKIVWHLNTHMCMHYGYWEKGTRRLRHALNTMNQKLTEYAQITETDRVLDAGCGVGGSSIFLAKNIGCNVHGITLSEKQVAACRRNAVEHGVANRAKFDRQNYLSTRFPDSSFDVVWGIESVCYAFDKKDFLAEAFRLLRPGGRLVVADFFAEPVESGSPEAKLLDKWTDTWAIKSYAETDEFGRKAEEVGFQNVVSRDVTDKVEPSIKRLYYSFFPGVVITNVSQFFGFRNKLQTANTWSTWYQYQGVEERDCGNIILSQRRNYDPAVMGFPKVCRPVGAFYQTLTSVFVQ